jgi:hypothetical protein
MKKKLLTLVLTSLISGFVVWAVTIGLKPWIVMQNALRRSTSVENINEYTLQAPVNQIAFAFGLFTADTDIGKVGATAPIADMLYAHGWLDLTDEPMIFDIPDFGNRYFVISFTDMWNMNTGYIGTRTTGKQGGKYAVIWQGWKGSLSSGITPIRVSTPQVDFWFRVFVAGPDDLTAADSIRRKVRLYPLSQLGEDIVAR